MGLAVGLGALASVILIALLVVKEIAGAAPGERAVRWSRTLNVGIVPLLIAFAVIVAAKVAQTV
ncbi:MAG: hypothetical protein JOZ41_06045 [Chloroflexi bacterium]|nr:hypothetical protein [Chloroflexota bacterium]